MCHPCDYGICSGDCPDCLDMPAAIVNNPSSFIEGYLTNRHPNSPSTRKFKELTKKN